MMTHSSTEYGTPSSGDFEISVANQQSRHLVEEDRLRAATRAVLQDSRFSSAAISVAVVDDAAIHDLNRRYLNHDWPTDVLSFVLETTDRHLEGEVVISADTAAAAAVEAGWSAAAEQLLYVVHGALHLVGYRDKTAEEAEQMRAAEAKYLRQVGIEQIPERHHAEVRPDGASENPAPRGDTDS